MTVPCLRPQEPVFEHETRITLEDQHGNPAATYDCRIEFIVASDDAVYVTRVDVLYGGPFGHWQDVARVEEPIIAASLLDKARDIDLLDTVLCEVEDRRAEQARADHELRIDNADDRGHAHRERIAERRMG